MAKSESKQYGPYTVKIDENGPPHFDGMQLRNPGETYPLPAGSLPYSVVETTDEDGKKSYSRDFGFLEVVDGELPPESADEGIFKGYATPVNKRPVDPKTGKRIAAVDL